MREDNRSREKFADELLDAALSNHRGAEPENGLEDRVLARLRRKSRAARPVLSNPAPVIIAMAVVLALFAVDHLIRRQPASDAAIAAVSMVDEPRGAGASDLAARQVKAGEREVVIDGAKFAKVFAVAPSSSRRRDLALKSMASSNSTNSCRRRQALRPFAAFKPKSKLPYCSTRRQR